MRTKVQRWGNSLAVRIPRAMAMDAALERDVAVEMTISKGVITVVRVAEETPKLAAMLAAITDDNLHGEVHWGPSVGNEAW